MVRHLVRAGILTAVIPWAIAFAMHWWAPWGCDASAWLCVFPLSLSGIAPIAALCLPLLFFFNQRRRHPFPDGWLSIMVLSGCVSQLLVSAYGLWLVDDHVRRIFFFDVLMFPHGLVAGVLIGAVFRGSLALPGLQPKTAR